MSNDAKSTLVGIARTAASFFIGAVATVFFLGGREARLNDIGTWKAETAPRIERMDSKGTLSFEYFHAEYDRTQARQESKLKELETELHQLERDMERRN